MAFTNSLSQAVGATGEVGIGLRVGGEQGTRYDVCSFSMWEIPKGLCIFTTVCLKLTHGSLLSAFPSH